MADKRKAVLTAVKKLSDSMQGVPVSIGMDALMTLAGVMLSATSQDKAEATRRAKDAGEKLVLYVESQYETHRADYLGYSIGKKH